MCDLKSRQIKASWALLDWSQKDLANAPTGLLIAAIRKLEMGHISPYDVTIKNVQTVFEENRLQFLSADGIRRCSNDIMTYQGPESVSEFFDDMCQTIKEKSGKVLVCAPEDFFDINTDHFENFV